MTDKRLYSERTKRTRTADDDRAARQDARVKRLSAVMYLNARPLYHGISQGIGGGRFSLVTAPPAECARMLVEGEVDAGLVPVAALARDGLYRVVPGVAVGCRGPVGSVVVHSERPIEELTDVVLDSSSRTSVVLLRLLLRRRLGREPRYVSMAPERLGEQVAGTTGALVIGDESMRLRGRFPFEWDLGGAWFEWTGLPFVFAVWAARAADLTETDVALLAESARRGEAALAEIAGGDPDKLRYLREQVRYALGAEEAAGLQRFFDLASDAGLLPEHRVSFFGERPRRRSSLDGLLGKAAAGERLSADDAVRLGEEASLFDLGAAADAVRCRKHGDAVVTYIIDRNINYTNVCVTACRFCAFFRPVGHAEGYTLSRETLAEKTRTLVEAGGIQILLQGGLNPDLPIEWYEDLFHWFKTEFPTVAMHALSPEEILYIARITGITLERTLERLHAAGLDSVPGGGAEVLVDRIRRQIAPLKCTSDEWLEVMRVAHRMGLRSSATMMFGSGETLLDRVQHFLKVRDLQDETGGFTAFISWDYQHDKGTRVVPGETGSHVYLRTQALSRLVLDNVPSIQSSWVTQGPGVGQAALRFGANDFGSVMFEENVVSAAGTTFCMDEAMIRRHIEASGFRPVRRNMRYELLA